MSIKPVVSSVTFKLNNVAMLLNFVITTVIAFRQDLKSGHPKCVIHVGLAQMSNLHV